MNPIRKYCISKNLTLEEFAASVGRKRNTVKKWARERLVPADAIPAIEHATGGELNGRNLRADLYPREAEPTDKPSIESSTGGRAA